LATSQGGSEENSNTHVSNIFETIARIGNQTATSRDTVNQSLTNRLNALLTILNQIQRDVANLKRAGTELQSESPRKFPRTDTSSTQFEKESDFDALLR
jgi:hypothetical protein